jgi:flagellar secretion chaperone FliS
MHVANPWKSYRQTATLTAPPGQIVLMLYEGALRSLERALPGFSCTDPGKANMTIHNNIKRAQEIVRELNCALNMEQGGDCAATLRRLYDYFDRRLWESNLRKRREGVDEVIGHLTELRDAWAAMLNQRGAPAGSTPATAPGSLATV